MTLDLDHLRRVAEAATPGPWVAGERCVLALTDSPNRVFVVVSDGEAGDGGAASEGAADHIATFDPPTVLALIERLEAAEAELADAEKVRAIWRQQLEASHLLAMNRGAVLKELYGHPDGPDADLMDGRRGAQEGKR